MSDKDKHTTMYSSSDIEKYLRGELSAPEMHALERAALDDPFLADALDGIALHRLTPEQPAFQEDVAELRERLQERVAAKGKSKARVIPLFMRYAAVVILLVGVGLIVFFNTLPHRKMLNVDVAQMERQVPAAAPVAKSAVPPAASANVPPVDSATGNADVATLTRPLTARKKEEVVLSENAAASRQSTVTEEDEHGKAESKAEIAERGKVARTAGLVDREKTSKSATKVDQDKTLTLADGRSIALDPSLNGRIDTMQLIPKAKAVNAPVDNYFKSPPADQLVFSGKVIDQNNHPLPGAFLALKNNVNVNAITDKDGQFNLRLNNRLDTTSAVVINYVGYEQASLLLNTENKNGNVIQLQPQPASLNEVVVEGYGAKRREFLRQHIDARQKELSFVAVPADGWPAYNEYLELKKKSANLDPTLRGDETISFVVNKKGALSSFKVEQSISPAHDSATINMIRQGPPWKLLSGKKERARVILKY